MIALQRYQFFDIRCAGCCLLSLLVGSLLGCGKETAQQAAPPPPKVLYTVAETQEVQDADVFVGQAEASQIVAVQSRVSGFLKTIEFEDGQQVSEGQLLATIEPDDYQAIHDQELAKIELAKTQFDLAETKYQRAKKLLEGSAVSREEYDEKKAAVLEAKAQIVVAEADAKRSALDLKYTNVNAAISGRIDRALVDVGNVVTAGFGAGTVLTRIVNTQPIYVNMDVDEASVLRYIRKGQSDSKGDQDKSLKDLMIPCFGQLQDESDFGHEGKLDFIQTGIDTSTGTIQVRGVFENKDEVLRDGMFVRVRIPTSEPYEAVLIPETAIGTDQSYKFAYVVTDDNKAERRDLTLGGYEGERRIVIEGIQAGEKVIAAGVQKVRPGMTVSAELAQP